MKLEAWFTGWGCRGAAVGLGGLFLFLVLGGAGCSPPEARHALARRELVLEQLTEAAVREVPKPVVLVVGNPFAPLPGSDPGLREVEEASVRGVQRGIGKAGARYAGIRHPALREEARRDPTAVPIPPGATTPVSFLTEPGAWDRLRSEVPEANLWVSLIGVPADLGETKAWEDPEGPRWALLLPDLKLIGNPDAVRSAFERGRLVALVLARPGAPPESEPVAGDRREEFERRYILVTRESLASVAGAWPDLFR